MTVTAPPRPPRPHDPVDRDALEALIEEARRRARRRRRWYGAGALLVFAIGAGAFFGFGDGGGGGGGDGTQGGEPQRRGQSERSSWKPLPPAPIAGRTAAGVVWTGTEMIIWGGVSRSTASGEVRDGAAYKPATRRWRRIAAPPAGVLGGPVAAAVWTGDAALFWVARWPDPPSGGAYYPKTDSWRPLTAGPFPSDQGYPSAWTGKELLVIRGALWHPAAPTRVGRLVAAALHPKTLTWRPLRALNRLRDPLRVHALVWNGSDAFLLGDRYSCRGASPSCPPSFLAYDPANDALRRISLSNSPIAAHELWGPFAWAKPWLLFRSKDWREGFIGYNAEAGRWRTGTPPPCLPPQPGYSQDTWLGSRYVAACGTKRLQIYTPVTNTWRVHRSGPSPLNSRSSSAIAWTGKELIVWSGSLYQPGNPTPADGASLRLER